MRRGLTFAAFVALSCAFLAPTGSGAGPRYLADCLGKPQVRPAEIILACGDGNAAVSDITWVGWGSTFAAGKGTATINDCKPSCVNGTGHNYPVVVILTGRQTCRPGGQIAYARLTLAFLDGASQRSGSQPFRCEQYAG